MLHLQHFCEDGKVALLRLKMSGTLMMSCRLVVACRETHFISLDSYRGNVMSLPFVVFCNAGLLYKETIK